MKWFVMTLVGFFLIFGSAVAQENQTSRSYRIGPRDQIQIRVDELPDLDSEQVVAEDGTIILPVIGTVTARGLTESELAFRVRAQLESEGLRKATVSVSVSAYRSRPVSILGAVGDPGNHFVPGSASLMEVLMGAGGLTENHGPTILIRRSSDKGLSDQVEIAVQELIDEGNPLVNIPIVAGDHINVPVVGEVVINFLGEVVNGGSQSFRRGERVTLLTAIARAGGLSETASKKIRVIRQSATGEREEFNADYRKILSGREPDIELEDGDLIVIKESFF